MNTTQTMLDSLDEMLVVMGGSVTDEKLLHIAALRQQYLLDREDEEIAARAKDVRKELARQDRLPPMVDPNIPTITRKPPEEGGIKQMNPTGAGSVDCPACFAPAGEKCYMMDRRGRGAKPAPEKGRTKTYHNPRSDLAKQVHGKSYDRRPKSKEKSDG